MFPKSFQIAELRQFVESTFVVRHISVEIEFCKETDDAIATRKFMEDRYYEFIGVHDGTRIVGYLAADNLLAGKCGDYVTSFTPELLVGANAPLIEVLPLLAVTPHLFVLERTSINQIVTRTDLLKSPMRMLLFSLVTLLDSAMLSIVRVLYPKDAFKSILPVSRLAKANELLELRKKKNEVIDLADCLQMGDKRDLLLKHDRVREFFDWKSKTEAQTFLTQAEDLRNRLAHAQDIDNGSSWVEIANVTTRIESFLKDCELRADEFMREFAI